MDKTQIPAPPPPVDPSECCGSGCMPCVYDRYDEELLRWGKRYFGLDSYQASVSMAEDYAKL